MSNHLLIEEGSSSIEKRVSNLKKYYIIEVEINRIWWYFHKNKEINEYSSHSQGQLHKMATSDDVIF